MQTSGESNINAGAGLVDSSIPLGRTLRQAAGFGADESSPEYQNAAAIGTGVQVLASVVSLGLSAASGAASLADDAANVADDAASKLYHYTSSSVDDIMAEGLQPGASGSVFTTPAGNLSPLQAQIDLALPPNRGLRQHLLEIDTKVLQSRGISIPPGQTVGRMFNMSGGGVEVVFPHAIPPQAIKVIR
jgi:hypothetical protein